MRFCNGYDYDIAIAILEKVGLPIEERIEQQTSSQSNTNPSFSYRESEQPPMSLEVPDRPALYSHSDSQFQSTNSSARTSRVLEIGLVSRASHLPPDQTPHRSAPDPEGRPPASHFESTTLSAVLPGPHQIHPEPTRHPGYFTSRSDPQKPLYSLHAVRSPTTLGFLATVPADTFNQILPPKRDLPLDEPVAKRRRQRKDIRPIGEVHHKSDVVLPKGGSTLTQAELGKLSNTELGQVFLDLTASEQTELWKTGPKKHAVMKSGQKKPAPEMVIFREAVPKEAVLKKVPIRKTPLRKLASKKAATTTAVVTTGEPLKISIAISPSKHSAKADSKQDFTISLPTISAHGNLSLSLLRFSYHTTNIAVTDTAADEAAVKGTIPGREVISLSSGNNDVLPLSTSSSNGQTSNRPQISQELVDHAENTIQQYRDRSVAVSTSASPAPTSSQLSPSGLEIYAALSKGERRTIIKRMVVETIMDENFVTLCEDMEDVLQTFGFESRTSEQR